MCGDEVTRRGLLGAMALAARVLRRPAWVGARALSGGAGQAQDLVRPGVAGNNVTASVAGHIGRNLLGQPNHPLQIVKSRIFGYFEERYRAKEADVRKFELIDNLNPVVKVEQAFDELLIPKDHLSRMPSDTFYVDHETCLRPHTSAHQNQLLRAGKRAFLCAGDVYRRDAIDSSHYPVFHQMEGVYVFPQPAEEISVEEVEADLKDSLEGLVRSVFGNVEMRWVDAYFPFTNPSLELEIYFNNDWLEVLGCGVVQPQIMRQCGVEGHRAWAFGLGLERLAMVLFDIPDIRLFWTSDRRFLEQFRDGEITKFQPYSKFPPCFKDISFWLPKDNTFHENDFYSVVREIGGDLIENVTLIDEFSKGDRTSHCYRINFRSMDRSLTNAEVDVMQSAIRTDSVEKLNVELR
jgi:phenylalanyl-tRNA synthetase alpha chain